MSDLRKQLESAKREYRAMRYPGDLAAEILKTRRSAFREYWPILALAAAAIAIALIFLIPNQTPRQIVSVTKPTTQNETVQETASQTPLLDSLHILPDMNLTAPAYDFDLSLPSFSLSADQQEKGPSTTQESV